MGYSFTIIGKIKPKERPRRGKYGHFYTPKATLDCEQDIALQALSSGLKPISGPVAVTAEFQGNYGRSDLDNLIKSLLDGMKSFFNDRQVVEIRARKTPAKEYLTKVSVIPA